MKLSDYVVDFIAKQNIEHVFGLTGGAVVHLFDSVSKRKGMQAVYCHHEQAAALAAVSYARFKNGLGAAIVTTGPGGTNAITGVTAAWQDSIPCLFISGQSRYDHTTHGKNLRQLGSQELDIVSIVRTITKYAVMVESPQRIRYHLEKAVYLARNRRAGPVWVDIPLNFQWIEIDPDSLESFKPIELHETALSEDVLAQGVKACVELLEHAERPLILAGYGIRLSHAETKFRQCIEKFQLPFLSSWTASDLIETAHPLYMGRPGVVGQRGANLAIQNCDLLLCIGSHLSIPLTGTMFDAFARNAKIVVVDIDQQELDYKTVRVDFPIRADAAMFLESLMGSLRGVKTEIPNEWREHCARYKGYNAVDPAWRTQAEFVNPYVFVDTVSDLLDSNDIVVSDGGGTVVYTAFQAFKVQLGQRLLLSSGICAMGTGVPETIGASFAGTNRRVICFSGDGAMQLNLQELQTIKHHNINAKIFVFNNDGYLAIRHTQGDFLASNFTGSETKGGVSLPDYERIVLAFGIPYERIRNHDEMERKLPVVLAQTGPLVCEIMINRTQEVFPRQGYVPRADGSFAPLPLEDMFPKMDRKEFFENMLVEPLPASCELRP